MVEFLDQSGLMRTLICRGQIPRGHVSKNDTDHFWGDELLRIAAGTYILEQVEGRHTELQEKSATT